MVAPSGLEGAAMAQKKPGNMDSIRQSVYWTIKNMLNHELSLADVEGNELVYICHRSLGSSILPCGLLVFSHRWSREGSRRVLLRMYSTTPSWPKTCFS